MPDARGTGLTGGGEFNLTMKTRAKKVNVRKLAEGCAIKIMGYHEFCCDSGWRASDIKKAFREGFKLGKERRTTHPTH